MRDDSYNDTLQSIVHLSLSHWYSTINYTDLLGYLIVCSVSSKSFIRCSASPTIPCSIMQYSGPQGRSFFFTRWRVGRVRRHAHRTLFKQQRPYAHWHMLLKTRATSEREGERKQEGRMEQRRESGQMAFQIELWVRGIAESPRCCPSSVWKARRVTQGDSKRLFKRNDADLCWHTNRNKSCCVFGNRTLPCGTPKRGFNYEENERTFFPPLIFM